MKKNTIAVLTALMMMATAVMPGQVYAAPATEVEATTMMYGAAANTAEKDSNSDGVTDTGFVYTVTGVNTVSITGYQGTATALTIPLQITVGSSTSSGSSGSSGSGTTTTTTYDVTAIGSYAFAGKAGLTSVTMQGGTTGTGSNNNSATTAPTGLKTIGSYAFYGCPSLTTITISATVNSIENQAFSDCPALTALNVTAGNQRYISNDGVLYEYVGYSQGTVGNYNTYTLLQYPSGKAGSSFSAPMAIANRLTVIGQGAFAGAQSLTSITLPDSVERIDTSAFQNCSALTTITLPTKITAVPNYAFSGCAALTSITIPDTVTTIGDYAFQNCYALNSIKLPAQLRAVNSGTFYGCSALKEVEIPSATTSIGASAFAYCKSLVKVTIPANVLSIGANAFLGVSGLTIYCHSGSQAANYANSNKIGAVMTYTVTFISDTGNVISSQEVVYGSAANAPSMPTRPGYQLSWSCAYKNITSDLTVQAIWTRVYTIKFIDGYTGKSSTDSVEYGKSAKAPKWTMSGYTLGWSKSYSSVTGDMEVYAIWTDPKTGFIIDKDTVKPASKGTEFIKGTVTYKVTSSNVQNPKVQYVSNSNTTLTSVSVPATVTYNNVKYKVTSIGDKALCKKTNLESVTIGSNVTEIGSYAFYKCKKLKKVKFNTKSLSTIDKKAFYGIKNNAMFYAYKSKLTSYQKKIKSSGISTTIKLKAIS